MAAYYWIGAQNSDVNNRYNWTLYNPGFTGATAANSRPVYGSSIVFTKFNGITGGGTSGATYYPLYGPSGFLYGATSSGSTALYLTSCQIRGDFDKDIGGENVKFSFYADEVIINKNDTAGVSTINYNYLNIYENPLGAGPTYANANVQVTCKQGLTVPLKRSYNTIEGYANNITIGDSGITTNSDVVVKNIEVTQAIENESSDAYDSITLGGDTVTVTSGSYHKFRGPVSLTVQRGLNFSDSVTLEFLGGANFLGNVNFSPFGVSGASGATSAKGASNIHTFKCHGNRSATNYDYYHGVYLQNFYCYGGKHTFYNQNDDPVIIRGGFVKGITTKLKSDIDSNVTILDSANYSGGFQIHNAVVSEMHNTLSLAGNYGLRLSNVPQGYTYG